MEGSSLDSVRDRFLSHVDRSGSCWMWRGGGDIYGKFSIDGRLCGAHRASFLIFNGPIAAGLNVCHSCDTPKCVNPSHLFTASQSENLKDSVVKGRYHRKLPPQNGELNNAAKLTESQAKLLIVDLRSGMRAIDAAKKFGICYGSAWAISKGKRWGHLQ